MNEYFIRVFLQVVQFTLVQIPKYRSILNQKDENSLALKSKSCQSLWLVYVMDIFPLF